MKNLNLRPWSTVSENRCGNKNPLKKRKFLLTIKKYITLYETRILKRPVKWSSFNERFGGVIFLSPVASVWIFFKLTLWHSGFNMTNNLFLMFLSCWSSHIPLSQFSLHSKASKNVFFYLFLLWQILGPSSA